MHLEIELPDETAKTLEQLAKRLAMSDGEVAAIAIAEFFRNEKADFTVALRYSLEKNKELLKRLAD